jgi:hypothetical protein
LWGNTKGFSSPRIVSVLKETGYLTSPSHQATYRRLLETTQVRFVVVWSPKANILILMGLPSQFVMDAMTDLMPVSSRGWASCVRVRMLHSQTRLRILKGQGNVRSYNVEKDGGLSLFLYRLHCSGDSDVLWWPIVPINQEYSIRGRFRAYVRQLTAWRQGPSCYAWCVLYCSYMEFAASRNAFDARGGGSLVSVEPMWPGCRFD